MEVTESIWTTDNGTMPQSSISESQRNGTYNEADTPSGPISWDDATWILACSFIIFTMQSGELCNHMTFSYLSTILVKTM